MEVELKTRIALYCYYLSISLLTVCAIGIVVKLLFWPPCTQTGNTCVIEPWSVAGLAATVLAVAATVLAVLGAVAVAAWWTALNDRVNEQVRKLYKEQSAEAIAQFDHLLKSQQEVVVNQFLEFQMAFNTETARLRTELDKIREEGAAVHEYSKEIGRIQAGTLQLLTEVSANMMAATAVTVSSDKNLPPANNSGHDVGG